MGHIELIQFWVPSNDSWAICASLATNQSLSLATFLVFWSISIILINSVISLRAFSRHLKKIFCTCNQNTIFWKQRKNRENNSYFSQLDFRLLIIFLYMPCNLNSNWDVFNNKWNICPCLLLVSFNTMSRSCLHLLFCSPIGVRFVVWSISHRRVTLQSRIMLRTLTLLSITFSGVRAPSCSNFWVSGNSFCNGKSIICKIYLQDRKLKYIFGYIKIKLSTKLTALYESYKLRLKAAEYVIQMEWCDMHLYICIKVAFSMVYHYTTICMKLLEWYLLSYSFNRFTPFYKEKGSIQKEEHKSALEKTKLKTL